MINFNKKYINIIISFRRIFFPVFLLFPLLVTSQIPSGYYDDANGLSGEALKNALHNIIKDHTELSYSDVKEALKVTDKDTVESNKVICFYTGWTYSFDSFGSDSDDWNREHVWSKSHGDFGNNPPAGTDLHQLRPTDASVNSAKGNRDFDWGTEEYYDEGGTLPTDCYESPDIWEPRDEVKGDVARIIFYMATRYEGDNYEPDLEIVDYVNTAENNEALYGKLSTLLTWHHNDPVDQWEIDRNNIIYDSYQHNRNPFIDHPEYVDSIWGVTIAGEPSNHVTDFAATAITSTSVTLSWNKNDGAVAAHGYLLMVNTTGNFSYPQDGTEISDDTDMSDGAGSYNISHSLTQFTCPGLEAGTNYYFILFPYTNSGVNINYKTDGNVPQTDTVTDTVSGMPLLIISEVADPSDNYKARFVEITNIGTGDIDLGADNWYLSRQANGNSWGDIPLTGIINKDSSIVISYNETDFEDDYGFSPTITNSSISGNGDDGYFLFKNGTHDNGILVDAYGVINVDGSNTAWEYANSKAYRIYGVTAPTPVWNENEWIIENASTQQMTPNWHSKTLIWTGAASQNFIDKNNWKDSKSLLIPPFNPDASCKLIIRNNGFNPVLDTYFSGSVIEIEGQVIFEITNNGTLNILNPK